MVRQALSPPPRAPDRGLEIPDDQASIGQTMDSWTIAGSTPRTVSATVDTTVPSNTFPPPTSRLEAELLAQRHRPVAIGTDSLSAASAAGPSSAVQGAALHVVGGSGVSPSLSAAQPGVPSAPPLMPAEQVYPPGPSYPSLGAPPPPPFAPLFEISHKGCRALRRSRPFQAL